MFCPTCGTNNPDDGVACKVCGSDLKAAAAGLSRPPVNTGVRPRRPPVATMLGVAQPGQGNIAPPSVPVPSAPAAPAKPPKMGTMLGVAMPAAGSAPMPVARHVARSVDRPLLTPRVLLAELIRARGPGLADSPAEAEALLYKGFQHDVSLLIAAQRAGVPAELSASVSGEGVAACVERVVRQLMQTQGISADDARYAVDSWALALGLAGT